MCLHSPRARSANSLRQPRGSPEDPQRELPQVPPLLCAATTRSSSGKRDLLERLFVVLPSIPYIFLLAPYIIMFDNHGLRKKS